MKNLYLVLAFTAFVAVNKINAQEITMFPGFFGTQYYEDDVKISKKQVESLLLKDPEANQLWKKSKKHMTIGLIAFGAEVGFLVWQLNRSSNNESQTVPLIGVLGTAGVSIGYGLSANNLKKKAILNYNQNADVGTINFGPTYNGIGLVLQF